MANHFIIGLTLIILLSISNVLTQCTGCTRSQGCCMGHMHGQWYCCAGSAQTLNSQQTEAWNFDLQINYDVYTWGCGASTVDPAKKYTDVSCILDGRWSLDHLTFQLKSIPSSELKSIAGDYTMKNGQTEKVAFLADSQWALTVPVDKNEKPDIYDKIQFNYGGFNYTYHFGYGPYPHCPRC
jgi:hypothetical protein